MSSELFESEAQWQHYRLIAEESKRIRELPMGISLGIFSGIDILYRVLDLRAEDPRVDKLFRSGTKVIERVLARFPGVSIGTRHDFFRNETVAGLFSAYLSGGVSEMDLEENLVRELHFMNSATSTIGSISGPVRLAVTGIDPGGNAGDEEAVA